MVIEKSPGYLRLLLTRKTVEVLEKLLVLGFNIQEDHVPTVDYTATILKLIEKIEGFTDEKQVQTELAWKEFPEYYRLRKQEELLETSSIKDTPHVTPYNCFFSAINSSTG